MITFYADIAKTSEQAAREDLVLQKADGYVLENLETGVREERSGFMSRYELREWVSTIEYGNLTTSKGFLIATSEM